jgi:hypothetical protein
MATTQATTTGSIDRPGHWKGLTDGVTSEWTLIGKVIPGQEKALAEFAARHALAIKKEQDFIIGVGTVHDYRFVIFENGTRLMFMSNFDGDWGQYIDDFFATKVVEESFDNAFSFCEGYPGRSASAAEKKEWVQAHTVQSGQYTRAYHGSVKEIWKALEVQKAFQSVLDDPKAAEALKNPALGPLLALASQ